MNGGIEQFEKQTEAQKIVDDAFIQHVRETLVLPLVGELDSAIEGFSSLPRDQRFFYLMKLDAESVANSECLGGDSMPLYFGSSRWDSAFVHAGVKLGDKDETITLDDDTVSIYKPLGFDDYWSGSPATTPLDTITNGKYCSAGAFIDQRKDEYDNLPLPYKVALLAQYVHDNLIADRASVFDFVTCATEDFHGSRMAISPICNSDAKQAGWVLRLRDVSPSNEHGRWIVQKMRNYVSSIDDWEKEQNKNLEAIGFDYSSFEKMPKKRSSRKSTDIMVAFIDGLIAEGKAPGSKEMSWKKALGLLNENYPNQFRYKTGVHLSDAYHKAKARREKRGL